MPYKLDRLMVISKKYYAGGEVVIELITPDNKNINCNMNITIKAGEDPFLLGGKYNITFAEEI